MASLPHEFVNVDMRDLKAALIERSRAERVSVSSLVRSYVAAGLGRSTEEQSTPLRPALDPTSEVKMSIRMSAVEADRIIDGARRAGLSPGAYIADLVAGASGANTGPTRSEQLAMVASTNAELSTLSRNMRHLVALANQGSGDAARQYAEMLRRLQSGIGRHLANSSAVLANLRSRRIPASVLPRTVRREMRNFHG